MIFSEYVKKILSDFLEKHDGNKKAAADALGISHVNLWNWVTGRRKPSIDQLSIIFEKMNIAFDNQQSANISDVCFVNAKLSPTADGHPPPDAEDYMAVPLAAEVGAGPGIIQQGELLSWFLVYKHQDAVRYRSNLVAVQIGKHSTSMVPILKPNDIVLVDLDDKDTRKAGRIMLVQDPMDGSGMIKRVAVEQRDDDYRITYYSDNIAENPPQIYSFREDFGKDWNKVVAGHVIWAWTDMSRK